MTKSDYKTYTAKDVLCGIHFKQGITSVSVRTDTGGGYNFPIGIYATENSDEYGSREYPIIYFRKPRRMNREEYIKLVKEISNVLKIDVGKFHRMINNAKEV